MSINLVKGSFQRVNDAWREYIQQIPDNPASEATTMKAQRIFLTAESIRDRVEYEIRFLREGDESVFRKGYYVALSVLLNKLESQLRSLFPQPNSSKSQTLLAESA